MRKAGDILKKVTPNIISPAVWVHGGPQSEPEVILRLLILKSNLFPEFAQLNLIFKKIVLTYSVI